MDAYCWAGIIIQENETATCVNKKIIGDLPCDKLEKILSNFPNKFSYRKLTEIEFIFREEIENSILVDDDLDFGSAWIDLVVDKILVQMGRRNPFSTIIHM